MLEENIDACLDDAFNHLGTAPEYANALREKLRRQCERHTEIKNYLHGDAPLSFDEIYHPLKIEPFDKKHPIRIQDTEELFAEGTPNHITIIGDAGSGKSTFVKYLFMDAIEKGTSIPFLVELRSLKTEKNESLMDHIVNSYQAHASRSILHKGFKEGNTIFFLDGYDELKGKEKVQVINDFIDLYPHSKFILTSRPSAGATHLERFENFSLMKMDHGDIEAFTQRQLKHLREGEDIKEKLMVSIKKGLKNTNIEYFLRSPLLLSIYILTYKDNPEIPDKKHQFYQRVFDALCHRHDTQSKLNWTREKESGLDQFEIREILMKLSFSTCTGTNKTLNWDKLELIKAIRKAQGAISTEFNAESFLNDMVLAIGLWVEDDGQYSFYHRSFQEYFACLYIKEHPEKIGIYKKLLAKLLNKQSSEINNLLEFLSQMDTDSFAINLKLPLFEKINDVLQDDERSFMTNNILYVYHAGEAKDLVREYGEIINIINNLEKIESHKDTIENILEIDIGIKIGMARRAGLLMGIECSIGLGWGSGLNVGLEYGLSIEKEIQMIKQMNKERKMAGMREIGMGIGLGVNYARAKEITLATEKGIITAAMEQDTITAAAEQDITKIYKEVIFSFPINNDPLYESSLKQIVEKIKDKIKRYSKASYNNRPPIAEGEFLGENNIIRYNVDILNLYEIPYIYGMKLHNLLHIFSDNFHKHESVKKFFDTRTFFYTKEFNWFSQDELPEEIIRDGAVAIHEKYAEYKKFIEDEIAILKKKAHQMTLNAKADLDNI